MTRDQPASFASYVTARGDALHNTAYRMTGDHAAAWPPWPPGRKQPRVGQTITVTVTMSSFEGPDWRLELGRSAT